MKSKLIPVDAQEGIRALIGELANLAQLPNSKGILFLMSSGKRIHLFNSNADSPRSTFIGRHDESTLRYTTSNLSRDLVGDQYVEVVRDHNGLLFFRDDTQLLLLAVS